MEVRTKWLLLCRWHFSNTFYWRKMFVFWWSLSWSVQLTISQLSARCWFGVKNGTSHYLNCSFISDFFIKENQFEYIGCNMAAILFRPQCVKMREVQIRNPTWYCIYICGFVHIYRFIVNATAINQLVIRYIWKIHDIVIEIQWQSSSLTFCDAI